MKTNNKVKRCSWVNPSNERYIDYHDNEWGVPVYDDIKLFEMLILEGAQAGLNWETILNRREGYRKLFKQFDPAKVARMTDTQLEKLLQDDRIIRNRLKVYSTRKNAQVFLSIQKEYGSFSDYLWAYVNGKPIINSPKLSTSVPTKTSLSDSISKDLKKRGMSFVGSTIMYAYLQAVGIVNDHTANCFRAK